MTNHKPTAEQSAIISAIANGTRNLQIRALAGAAKTSTLVMSAEHHRTPTLAIAFNKKNAVELGERMPSHIECKTLHSVGMATWRDVVGRVSVDMQKTTNTLKAELDNYSGATREALGDAYPDILKAINKAYSSGWAPEGLRGAKSLIETNDDFFENHLPVDFSQVERQVITAVMASLIEQGQAGKISFDDMVYLPTIFPARFNPYPMTYIDEAQDLSPLNHQMLWKLTSKGTKRLIAVGDPFQAIYGFRGADEASMDTMCDRFDMDTLDLSTSFRCARSVAEHVRWRAPTIQSPDWAPPGTITHAGQWDDSLFPPSAFIICRNNAPLLSLAMRLIRAGRKPEILGNDITKGLIKALKDLGKPATTQTAALAKWAIESKRLRARYKDSNFVNDKIACIEHFLNAQPTLGLAIAMAEKIINATGPLQLMTGHKAKGLEADNVFILDEHLLGDAGQELNLRYVMATRAKLNLTYIQSSLWEEFADA